MIKYLAPLFLLLSSLPAFAWGERGHDAVARIAARLLANDEDPEVAAWGKLLASKEHMLAHLANIPDIAWRRGGPEMDRLNSPSHFIDLEFMLPNGELKEKQEFPATIAAYKKLLLANCSSKKSPCAPGETIADKLVKAGHAPFRIEAMSKDIARLLGEVKKAGGTPVQTAQSASSNDARTELVSQALLEAGLLAHFVGDLANPHHTSADYDGWKTGQGGLHSYFESELVDAQDLGLEAEVYLDAKRHSPSLAIFSASKGDPLSMAWAMVRESHGKKALLGSTDQRFSLLKPSEGEKDKDREKSTRAQRRPPYEVSREYRDLIVARLAVGADALAQFWKTAYLAAGKPDVSFYRSYAYPLDPPFVALGYDVESK